MTRRAAAALLAITTLAFISGLALAWPAASSFVHAQTAGTALGVDVDPANNTANHVADVQNCKEVAVGDEFPVDVFADNIEGLAAWELRFAFDHNVVQIVDHNYNMFLLSTAPSGSILPALFDRESDDRYFLAAAEISGTPDTGSGVLARITLKAIAAGTSPAEIVVSPGYLAPYLTKTGGAGLFSGPVAEAAISVGRPCSGPTPTVVPASTPRPSNNTPGPSGTPSPSGAPVSSATPGPGAPVVIVDSPGTTPDSSGEAGASGGDDPGATPAPPGIVRQTGGSAPQDDDPDSHGASTAGRQDSSGFPWLLTGAITAAILAAGAAGTLAFVIRYKS
ncbi:MAG: hypothetical protein Q7T33_04305 [Dehalococcoidia bacterium]|nr:hypothetical protein [Dehalococcoidia bacterium]